MDRNTLLQQIQSNINIHGYHITSVAGTVLPRFVYTIGCTDLFGSDLVFCGGEAYSQDDMVQIIKKMVTALKNGVQWKNLTLQVDNLGSFSLSEVDNSWSKLITLGIFDYYKKNDVQVLQISPSQDRWTLDIPDMTKPFNVESEPVWQWLIKEWNYPIPSTSTVVTNVEVLYGEKATQVIRWEHDEWEIFSKPVEDVPKDDMCAMPLAILLGIDESLQAAIHLQTGDGLWRDKGKLLWNEW